MNSTIKEKLSECSIYKKILIYVGTAMALILACMELFSILYIRQQQKRVMISYQDTVDFYADYWGTKLSLADQSLLVLLNSACEDYYYDTYGERTKLEYELAGRKLMQELEETGIVYSNELYFFYYQPGREIYIDSGYPAVSTVQRKQLENSMVQNIDDKTIDYGRDWTLLDVDGEKYLYQIYLAEDGYCGAVVNFSEILRGMEELVENTNYATLTDETGQDLIFGEQRHKGSYYKIKASLDKTGCDLTLMIGKVNIYRQIWLFALGVVILTAVMVTVLWHIIGYQKKELMIPLAHLNYCMKEFGQGNTQIRADESRAVQEVRELLNSFNEMAEQITQLKISVYEAELEKERTRYNYLKVQIQPHFYTNVLNLIYGLAEIQKYKDIQKLSLSMAKYFRYLMDDKGDLVPLRRELDCINSYVEIQQLRYGGMIRLEVYPLVDTDHEMIPPIVIQTFVENSIKYNITMIKELTVQVVIEKEYDKLLIRVEDNGCGFPEEIRAQLMDGQDISVDGKHIGIRNVQMRLEALYGKAAKMTLDNQEGARVYLEIPSHMEQR